MKAVARGFSIVEVLVALIVLSVGMLGIASLYVASLKVERTSLARTQAVNLVSDMIDRIRANPRAASAYALSKTTAPTSGTEPTNCLEKNCLAADLAYEDLSRWLLSVGRSLPGSAAASVTYSAAISAGKPETYQVRVEWKEPSESQQSDVPTSYFYQATVLRIAVIL